MRTGSAALAVGHDSRETGHLRAEEPARLTHDHTGRAHVLVRAEIDDVKLWEEHEKQDRGGRLVHRLADGRQLDLRMDKSRQASVRTDKISGVSVSARRIRASEPFEPES